MFIMQSKIKYLLFRLPKFSLADLLVSVYFSGDVNNGDSGLNGKHTSVCSIFLARFIFAFVVCTLYFEIVRICMESGANLSAIRLFGFLGLFNFWLVF